MAHDLEMIARACYSASQAFDQVGGKSLRPIWDEAAEEVKEKTRIKVLTFLNGTAGEPKTTEDLIFKSMVATMTR